MRIGLVIEHFDPRRGGVEQWTAQFAARLIERGHEVHVVARSFSRSVTATRIVPHPVAEAPSRIDFAQAARDILESLDLDVVHDTGYGWYCDVFQPHGGSRLAVAEQNLLLLPKWMRRLKRAISGLLPRYRQFDALTARQFADDGRTVLALSRRVAADFTRFHSIPSERTRLVYNGVDTERFHPDHRREYRHVVRDRLGIGRDELVFLIVAHNFKLKGVPTLLAALSDWRRQERHARLLVVGGKHARRYRWSTWLKGLSPLVTFTGAVDDPVPYYAASDVYVQPTFYDPCSLVVLEALGCGLPVITTRLNGAGELVTEAKEGYLLSDPADAEELLSRMEMFFDADLRRRMGTAARALAEKHSFERNVRQVLAIYEEILAERRLDASGAQPVLPASTRFTGRVLASG